MFSFLALHVPSKAQLCGCNMMRKLLFPLRWNFDLVACCGAETPPQTRKHAVDERSCAFYLAGSRAGLCHCWNPGYSCFGGVCAGFRPWLLSTGRLRKGNTKTRVDERSTSNFAFYLAFGHAGLTWPKSGLAVPATLVSSLGCFQRARHPWQTQKRT